MGLEVSGLDAVDEERIAARVLGRVTAITFTDAAASEMATKIGAAFETLAAGDLPPGLARDCVSADAAQRTKRARAPSSGISSGAPSVAPPKTVPSWR